MSRRRFLDLLGVLVLLAGLALALAHATRDTGTARVVMAVAVSSDGRYALSSHRNRELILWDLHRRTHKTISTHANIYSAAFVPGRHAFLWQDLDDLVRVQTNDGELLKSFQLVPVYSHAISGDLQTYLASDEAWRLWSRIGTKPPRLLKQGDSGSLLGLGKALSVQLGSDPHLALTAGFGAYFHARLEATSNEEARGFERFDGVALWDLHAGWPVYNFPGNSAKTHATLSPDGKFVVSVDENAKAFVWDTMTGGLAYRVSGLGAGVYVGGHELGSPQNWDASGMHLNPEDLPDDLAGTAQLGVHFVGARHFVILHTYHPYAVLYELGDPFALAILPLGEDPFPSVASYARNAAIDSAPEAGILVTGQRQGGGINVYRFDPGSQSLERIWTPTP